MKKKIMIALLCLTVILPSFGMEQVEENDVDGHIITPGVLTTLFDYGIMGSNAMNFITLGAGVENYRDACYELCQCTCPEARDLACYNYKTNLEPAAWSATFAAILATGHFLIEQHPKLAASTIRPRHQLDAGLSHHWKDYYRLATLWTNAFAILCTMFALEDAGTVCESNSCQSNIVCQSNTVLWTSVFLGYVAFTFNFVNICCRR